MTQIPNIVIGACGERSRTMSFVVNASFHAFNVEKECRETYYPPRLPGKAFHDRAINLAGILRTAGAKGDLIAAQPARYRHGAVAACQRAGKALIVLLNNELALRQFPHYRRLSPARPRDGRSKTFRSCPKS